jgi:hypothetical protein
MVTALVLHGLGGFPFFSMFRNHYNPNQALAIGVARPPYNLDDYLHTE